MPVVGDVGTKIQVTVKSGGSALDLSSASTLELTLRRPDGTSFTRTGSLAGDGTDGRFDAVLQSGDLSAAGNYVMQARVVTPAGEWRSNLKTLTVLAKLD